MHLTSLPDDIIYDILRQLSIRDILTISTINRHFNRIANNQYFWRRLITEFDATIKQHIDDPKNYYLRELHFAGPIFLHDKEPPRILSQNRYIAKRDLISHVETLINKYGPEYAAYYSYFEITSEGIVVHSNCTLFRKLDLTQIQQIDIIVTKPEKYMTDRIKERITKSRAYYNPQFLPAAREQQKRLRLEAANNPNFIMPLVDLALQQRKDKLIAEIVNNSSGLNYYIRHGNHKVKVLGFNSYNDFVEFQKYYVQRLNGDQIAGVEFVINNCKQLIYKQYQKEDQINYTTMVFNSQGQIVMIDLNESKPKNSYGYRL